MQTLKVKKVKILMIILILLIQAVAPLLTVIVENSFTLTTFATTTEWDISATEEDNVKAVFDITTKTLTISGTGEMKNLISSTTELNATWNSIGNNIKKVIIEKGVTNIGNYAFTNCSKLEEIIIPNSVTSIGWDIFSSSSSLIKIEVDTKNEKYSSKDGLLYNKEKTEIIYYPKGKTETKFEIPEGVTSIGEIAFSNCTSLKEIIIPEGVTSIGRYAFSHCSNLEKVIIPNSIKGIENYAFYCCSSLKEIIIPEGVTFIGSRAFSACSSLKKITISSSVTGIGNSTFSGCINLEKIEVDTNNEKYSSEEGILYNKKRTQIICYPAGKIGTKFEIPEGVTNIGIDAFLYCNSLKEIVIPSSVTNIGGSAFKYCSKLEEIIIPEGVTNIKDSAFYYCSSLKEIVIPDSVTNIEKNAFYCCSSLKEIVIPSSVTKIGDGAFSNCRSLKEIIIPERVTNIGDNAFYFCSNLEEITIPSSVTSIGSKSFYGTRIIKVVKTEEENIQELELPGIIKRAIDEDDILYTEKEFTLKNCSLSEDKTKLIVDTEIASKQIVSLKVEEGALEGLTVIVQPSRKNNIQHNKLDNR